MKLATITSKIAIVLAVGVLTFTSCKKKKETVTDPVDTDTEQTTAQDNSTAEATVNDIESVGSQAAESQTLTNFRTSGDNGIELATCASVITNTATKTFTVDFGTTGCTGGDGKVRTGQLIFDYSGSTNGATRYRNPGFKLTVTSVNYVVDGYSVTITNKTITNTTAAPITGNLTWNITANVLMLKPGGGTINWICNRNKELTNTNDNTCYNGQNAPINWSNAIVKLNGSASGTNAKGESYTSTAVDLIRSFKCSPDPVLRPHKHPFIGGTLTYSPANRYPRIINYGDGVTCDSKATLTINGVSYDITL